MTSAISKFLAATAFGASAFLLTTTPASAQVAPTPADLYDSNLAFIKLDKTHTSIGGAFGMHFISTVNVNGTIYAYYIKYDTSTPSCLDSTRPAGGIGLATSTDGLNFTDHGFVLHAGNAGSWDCDYAAFPDVWVDGGIFYMAYEGSGASNPQNIGLATSTDGQNFSKIGPIFYHQTAGWEKDGVGTPSLYKENGVWYLFYHGYNVANKSVQIGVASGTNIYGLTRYSGNPVISTVAGTWQAGTAGKRSIQKYGGAYYMVYEGSEAPPYNTAKWSSGMAASTDLLHWVPFPQNALLPQVAGFGNDGPNYLSLSSGNFFYYRSGGATRRAMFATDTFGGFDTSWGMQSAGIGHVTGRLEADGGWSTNVLDPRDYVQYGPYSTTIPVGDNIATWKVMLDNTTADNGLVFRLEIVDATTGGTILTQRDIKRKEFKQPYRYEYISLPFNLPVSRAGHSIEMRMWSYGNSYIKILKLGVS